MNSDTITCNQNYLPCSQCRDTLGQSPQNISRFTGVSQTFKHNTQNERLFFERKKTLCDCFNCKSLFIFLQFTFSTPAVHLSVGPIKSLLQTYSLSLLMYSLPMSCHTLPQICLHPLEVLTVSQEINSQEQAEVPM